MSVGVSVIPGAVKGVCAAACDFDLEGVCSRCGCLDPEDYILYRLPTKETAAAAAAREHVAAVAEKHGLNVSLERRRV